MTPLIKSVKTSEFYVVILTLLIGAGVPVQDFFTAFSGLDPELTALAKEIRGVRGMHPLWYAVSIAYIVSRTILKLKVKNAPKLPDSNG